MVVMECPGVQLLQFMYSKVVIKKQHHRPTSTMWSTTLNDLLVIDRLWLWGSLGWRWWSLHWRNQRVVLCCSYWWLAFPFLELLSVFSISSCSALPFNDTNLDHWMSLAKTGRSSICNYWTTTCAICEFITRISNCNLMLLKLKRHVVAQSVSCTTIILVPCRCRAEQYGHILFADNCTKRLEWW